MKANKFFNTEEIAQSNKIAAAERKSTEQFVQSAQQTHKVIINMTVSLVICLLEHY